MFKQINYLLSHRSATFQYSRNGRQTREPNVSIELLLG
jgi:hypothetical protein